MSDLIFSIEVAVGLLVALAGGYLVAVVLRRRIISRGGLTTMCAYRRAGGHAWRQGFIRFGEGDLEWFPLGGVSTKPRYVWSRRGLDLGNPQRLDSGQTEAVGGMVNAIWVECTCRDTLFALALAEPAYTALRSWVESAPPESASAVN